MSKIIPVEAVAIKKEISNQKKLQNAINKMKNNEENRGFSYRDARNEFHKEISKHIVIDSNFKVFVDYNNKVSCNISPMKNLTEKGQDIFFSLCYNTNTNSRIKKASRKKTNNKISIVTADKWLKEAGVKKVLVQK